MSLSSNKENRIYAVFIFVLVTLLAVFFTSKLWLYDDNPIRQTTFNKKIDTLNQTEFVLLDWKYNQNKQFMEIVLDKKFVGDDSIPPTYEFESRDIELEEDIPTKVVYESDDMIVLHLTDIPEKYKFIDLKITEKRNEEVVRAEKDELSTDDSQEETDMGNELFESNDVTLTGDYREIDVDNKLTLKSGKEYEIETLKNEIALAEQEKKEIEEEKIPVEDTFIVEEETKIERSKEELEYLSGDEKEEMEQLISNYESKIKSSIEKKEEYEEAVNGLEKKIEGLNKKLDDMLNEEDKESKKNKKNDSKKSKDENKKEKNREGRGGDKSDGEKEVAFIYSCPFPFAGSF